MVYWSAGHLSKSFQNASRFSSVKKEVESRSQSTLLSSIAESGTCNVETPTINGKEMDFQLNVFSSVNYLASADNGCSPTPLLVYMRG